MIMALNCEQLLFCYLCNYEPANPGLEHFFLLTINHNKEGGDEALKTKQNNSGIKKKSFMEKYKNVHVACF